MRLSGTRIFVTQHSRYVIAEGVCVAVLTADETVVRDHRAIGAALLGGLHLQPGSDRLISIDPGIGDRLVFANDLMTSCVVEVAQIEPSLH